MRVFEIVLPGTLKSATTASLVHTFLHRHQKPNAKMQLFDDDCIRQIVLLALWIITPIPGCILTGLGGYCFVQLEHAQESVSCPAYLNRDTTIAMMLIGSICLLYFVAYTLGVAITCCKSCYRMRRQTMVHPLRSV